MPKLSIPLDSSHLAILGIQCPLFKGHNIVHYINKNLLLELKRDDDLLHYPPEPADAMQCLFFFQNVESEHLSYFVISHKNPKPLFLKYPQVDFLLAILFPLGVNPSFIESKVEEIIQEIQHIEQVFNIEVLDLEKLASADYFIQDFLLHMAQVNQKYKAPRAIRPRKVGFGNPRN